jgi:hypothetical protein
MSASKTLTFKQTPAHRPGEADVLNGDKENATSSVPPHMPAAEEYMQMARQIVALGSMAPLLRASVGFVAGNPVLQAFACVRDDLIGGDFTLAHPGAGVVEITWDAGTFPAPNTRPIAATNADAKAFADAVNIANGVRIRTFDAAGAAADVSFTCEVF